MGRVTCTIGGCGEGREAGEKEAGRKEGTLFKQEPSLDLYRN